MTQPVPTSPTGPPPPFPPAVTPAATPAPIRPSPLNDLTEDISKILQSSLHNGSGGSSSISTNHNNNHSSDKRLFGDESLSAKANHKEDSSVDEKQNSRVRRKAKATNVTSSTTAAVAPTKQNQHKHTNGLNNTSTDKILSNCLNLLNGDEESVEEEEVEKWRAENNETRLQAFREIRKFGRDYSGLKAQLEKIKGTNEMRFEFVQMCITEANRFRRKQMINYMEEWWETQSEGKNGDATVKMKS